jgi:hypothetical protein
VTVHPVGEAMFKQHVIDLALHQKDNSARP